MLQLQTPEYMLNVITNDIPFLFKSGKKDKQLLRSSLQELLGILDWLAVRDNFSYPFQAIFGSPGL